MENHKSTLSTLNEKKTKRNVKPKNIIFPEESNAEKKTY